MKRKNSELKQRTILKKPFVFYIFLVAMLLLLSGCGTTEESIQTSTSTSNADYTTALFGVDIISLEIIADETQWQTMLDNATDEAYIKVDVVVNGTRFNDVGIRPKGNSSLTQVASTDSDRYSFRLKFDEYVDGQTCFGLDNFVVNNMIGDNTYMKEYISYDLMKTLGVEAPNFGFADITVNGASWGLYLAVEVYNDSYEERVFGDTSGMLYNVKISMDKTQPRSENFSNKDTTDNPIKNNDPIDNNFPMNGTQDNTFKGGNFSKENMPGGMGAGNTGGSLAYIDDNATSYSSIFDNAVGKSDEDDYARVITALKALSTGTDIEKYFDVDATLKYLAAHTFVVNLDSYSSTMAQNYYLYENNGQLTILPWDYNLAWGGFQSSDASSIVNFPIDTPVSGVDLSERPLLEKLLSNTDYLAQYHAYLQQLTDTYFADGHFKTTVETLDTLISEYVKNDPTAFCTFEEYQTAINTFIELGELRAESVSGQLAGTIPSTNEEQAGNPDLLINASSINLSDLGTMMDGKGGFPQGGMQGNPNNGQSNPNAGQGRPNINQDEQVPIENTP